MSRCTAIHKKEQNYYNRASLRLMANVFDLFCLVYCVRGLVPRSPPGAGKWSTQGQVTSISFFYIFYSIFIANFLYLYMTAWSAASHVPFCWMDKTHDRRRVLIKYSGYILSIRRRGEKEEEGRWGYLRWRSC
jgi:hypothetical protein